MIQRELEYIVAIAEAGNITKAAEKLHVAQPSLTQKVQRLEKELGCKLLIRTNSGVKLTEEGEAYYQMAKQSIQVYEGFLSELGQLQRVERGKLRIGASWYVSTTFLPHVLADYSERYPNVVIDLSESRSSELLEFLRSGKLDVAFVSQYPYELSAQENRFQYMDLCRDDFCVVASGRRDLNQYRTFPDDGVSPEICLEQLGEEPFIMFRRNQRLREITDMVLRHADIRPVIKMTTYGFPIAVEQVANDCGIAIMPRLYIEAVRKQYDLQVFSIPPKYDAYWNIGMCFYRSDVLPFALQAFIDIIGNVFPQAK